jgi:hypothetical protein
VHAGTRIRQDPEAQELWQLSAETRCIRRFHRTFLRPAFKPPEATETSKRAHTGINAGRSPLETPQPITGFGRRMPLHHDEDHDLRLPY